MSSEKEPLVDPQGRPRTYSLFIEYPSEGLDPLWTIKDRSFKGYKSLKQIYLSYEHIPGYEYDFAMDTLGSWEHWDKLCTSSGLRKVFQDWRTELEIRNKATAMRSLIRSATEASAAGINAAKYISEAGYARKRGRPSKEEVERERKIQAGVDKELEDDMERLGLKLVAGKK